MAVNMLDFVRRCEEARETRDKHQSAFERELKAKTDKAIKDLIETIENELVKLWGLAVKEGQHNNTTVESVNVAHGKTSGSFAASEEITITAEGVAAKWEFTHAPTQPEDCPAVKYNDVWFYYEPPSN